MINFAIRNIKVYFRDRTSVFFSILSVLIIFVLYALFLGSSWQQTVPSGVEGGQALLDSWLMAGILAVISYTTTAGAYGTMVDDKAKKIYKDFQSSPMKRSHIVAGYVISSYVIGVIMSLIALLFLDVYMLIRNGIILGFIATLETIGMILLVTLANSAMIFFIISFIKSLNAFGTFNTIVGTLIGFVAGIYMPIFLYPAAIQLLIKVIPVSHAASLFRTIIMKDPIAISFNGAPAEIVDTFKDNLGVTFTIGSFEFKPLYQILFLLITTVVFFGLSLLVIRRKAK